MNLSHLKPLVLVTLLALTTQAQADPVRVDNGDQPAHGTRVVNLEALWTLGGEDSDLFFGVINRVLIDAQENIYLLDGQLAEVQVISPEGEHLRTLGREGDGPGEFRNPNEMAFLPDGTLGILQGMPGKVIRLDREDGTPASSWSLSDAETGGFFEMQGLRVGGGSVIVAGSHQILDQEAGIVHRDNFLAYVDPETGLLGREVARRKIDFDLTHLVIDENNLVGGPEGRYGVLPDGRTVVFLPRNGYEANIYSPDGTLELVFTRKFESWQRDAYAAGIWERILRNIEQTQVPGSEIAWEDTEADVQQLHISADGHIWVQNARGRWDPPAGVFTTFDVFDGQGVFTEEVQFVCDGNPRQDMIFLSDRDLVFKVGGFWDAALSRFGGAAESEDEEAQPVTVTCYRIKG